jgi:hypothetical protein
MGARATIRVWSTFAKLYAMNVEAEIHREAREEKAKYGVAGQGVDASLPLVSVHSGFLQHNI